MQRTRHSQEFKEQARSKVKARGSRTLVDMAGELNISLGTLKGWLKTVNKVLEAPLRAKWWAGHPRKVA